MVVGGRAGAGGEVVGAPGAVPGPVRAEAGAADVSGAGEGPAAVGGAVRRPRDGVEESGLRAAEAGAVRARAQVPDSSRVQAHQGFRRFTDRPASVHRRARIHADRRWGSAA